MLLRFRLISSFESRRPSWGDFPDPSAFGPRAPPSALSPCPNREQQCKHRFICHSCFEFVPFFERVNQLSEKEKVFGAAAAERERVFHAEQRDADVSQPPSPA